MTSMTVFGKHDERTVEQLERCAVEAWHSVLCADGHVGYSQPIGGAVAYEHFISPSGVGYDIGCGNKAVATNLLYPDIRKDLPRIMDEIVRRISFGMGQSNDEQVRDHPIYDRIMRDSPVPAMKTLIGKARTQLGTVGGGNHYVDLFREQGTDRVWIGVHFGSRGFGHTIAEGFLSMAAGKGFTDRVPDAGMDAEPTLLDTRGGLGHAYIEAMTIAGEYAYAGRDVVCDKVLEILGAESIDEVHNHHNYAWREKHSGVDVWVIRKGCTPAFPGQRGFVGGSMGDISVILEGRDTDEAGEALFSTVHGAGRQMSRGEAKGKVKRRKRFRNNLRDDETLYETQEAALAVHGATKATKTWVEESKSVGKIDWPSVRRNLSDRGIHLRGGDADEAPGAYKRLPEVLEFHQATIDVLKVLDPVGVAMAGPHVPRDD